jgi:hypothetical protein
MANLVSRKTGEQAAKAALYLALSLAFCAALVDAPLALAGRGWDQHLFFYGQVLKNVVDYDQAPYWSPWYSGGNVMWQNPQVALLSPVFPLALVVPLQLAMKLNIAVHYWAGFMGMHLLITRVMGLSSCRWWSSWEPSLPRRAPCPCICSKGTPCSCP